VLSTDVSNFPPQVYDVGVQGPLDKLSRRGKVRVFEALLEGSTRGRLEGPQICRSDFLSVQNQMQIEEVKDSMQL
jgi:hypothetical protein